MSEHPLVGIFKEITKIPKCSHRAQKMFEFLVGYSKEQGFILETDKAGNIRAYKEPSRVCLQGHYDIVCIGDAENIEVMEEDGCLKAKNSSLGADNCVAIAYMMELMKTHKNVEYLFTADEEVGLVGAKALELDLQSKYLLNIDSEEEGHISLGCAGGFEIVGDFELFFEPAPKGGYFYEISSKSFKGGHSGIDIDKGIKNAIKELVFLLSKLEIKAASINGGERLNSIPVGAKATLWSSEPIKIEYPSFEIRACEQQSQLISNTKELLSFICAIPSGILDIDKSFGVVSNSINLSKITQNGSLVRTEMMGRANSDDALEKNIQQIRALFSGFGCKNIDILEKYPAWTPVESDFARLAKDIFEKRLGKAEYVVYHAGFECGVIVSKFPHMQAISVGPNIYNPHSRSERVEIDSMIRVYEAIKEVVDRAG